MDEESEFTEERQRMVAEQLRDRDIRAERVLQAMASVPRHLFVPRSQARMAYADGPLPIGNGQTISQPYIVALMTQMLELKGGETVLEIGTGSGYQAAVLSRLARQVHSIERYPDLAEKAALTLERLGYANVQVHVADGSLGWPPEAPYQAIIVTAAAPVAPQTLLDQLADNGRMVVPVGGRYQQHLECWDRHGNDFTHEAIVPVAFVPLRGQFGWPAEGEWRD